MIMISRANQELCSNRLREHVSRHVDQDIFLQQKGIRPSELSPNEIV